MEGGHPETILPPLNCCRYTSEQDCVEALIALKWPNGYICPRCAHPHCSRLTTRRIPLFECGKCAYQTSPLVGTIFEGTHLPLLKWFQAMELFLLPDGISAMRLSRVIHVTYKTAWLMLHKIRHAIGEFDTRELLSGDVKVNSDLYGFDPSRGQLLYSRSSAVVAGCTVTDAGEPEHVKIQLVPQNRREIRRANRRELAAFITENVEIRTSEIQSFPIAYRLYTPLRKVVREAWGSLRSTYVALGRKYLQAYLNEYTVRRRLRLSGGKATMSHKLLCICVAIPTISYHQLIARIPNPPLVAAA
ncbi:transposase [Paenibacillus sp. DXFW5]|uniref:Transposase n=1 Tax=Paenibacillus rhizolycopersici TaxID=2780073 RepID=A0ABS2H762_9BACL|nr:transposase [Paenibacillus rhizolycopersici]MBM6995359.1 transposase [Paenibacillus rhizolycopersici]